MAYEWDRVVGVSFGNADFQSCIKRFVRRGEVFRAYPTCFAHIDAAKMLQTLKTVQAARDVVLAGEGDARHAVRVKICPYPEGTMAVWVMLAACYER